MNDDDPYSAGEELANAITHGMGFIIGIVVLALLIVFSCLRQGTWEIVSVSVYGSTFILLFLSSTLYHSARKPGIRRTLKIIDHSTIYLLIAGTYTPYALVPLHGTLGWICSARCRRTLLFIWGYILCLEIAQMVARHLASVRSGRQFMPFFQYPFRHHLVIRRTPCD
ncbi:MAG: hemolysin III family protein [Pontiella sp.]